jgi:hypothetical protein
MKTQAVLFLLIIFFNTSISQNTVFSYQPAGADAAKPSPYESTVVCDKKNSKTTVIVRNGDHAEYLLLSKDFKVEGKLLPAGGLSGTVFKAGFFKYLAGLSNNLGSCFFYSVKDKDLNGGEYHIRMEVADFKNKTVSSKMLFSIPADEKTIDWYANEGSFVLLTANDKTSQFVFHITDPNGKQETKKMSVNLDGFNKEKYTLSEYFSSSHVFSGSEETELPAATDYNKIYLYSDKLVMVVIGQSEPPHIWTIDTQKFSINGRKLDMTGFVGFDGKKSKFFNSAQLFDKNLYLLNTSKNKIEIGIFDLASGKLIKKHDITESSTIPFVETPVEITTRGRLSKKNVITSNKELCKELFRGSTGMAVAINSKGELILTGGVYNKENRVTSGYYAGGMTQSTMTTGGTHAGSNVPVTRTYTDFNSMANYREGSSYSFTRTVSFKVIVDPVSFDIVKSNDKLSGLDKINEMIESIDDKSQAQNVFALDNKHYLSYYLPSAKTFYIKEMER